MIRGSVTAITLLLASCMSDVAPLVASDVRINGPLPGTQVASGYLTLTNNSSQSITITAVDSPQFGRVEMHESVTAGGVARMLELHDVTIPGHSSVSFAPGGKHLMLRQPVDELDEITLKFRAGQAVVLSIDAAVVD